ncbi:hypothetical protein L3V79_07265 [Thiotrichales bacterium 19S9-12]|nr:hypothetical protein [Thiotrichales bacterium 19S9-11]MCF6812150.1 hypothetical protein [Thiotrichales bacterium 19S9-12]
MIDNTVSNSLQSKSARVSVNPQDDITVQAADEQYESLAQTHKKSERKVAEQSGESYIASIFSFSDSETNKEKAKSVDNGIIDSKTVTDPKSFYENRQKKEPTVNKEITQATVKSNITNEVYTGYVNLEAQKQIAKQMSKGLQDLSKTWGETYSARTVRATQSDTSPSSSNAANSPVIIKAGDIMFAVIGTAVNSDQVGTPVMATIVTGEYKGTKLLGSFQRANDRLVVQFNLMSMPQMSKSIGISAYAIDSRTAQTALASNVDYHYLTRWGGLMASSFLAGFGDYFSDNSDTYELPSDGSGNTYVINASDTGLVARNGIYSGLGEVGNALSDKMSKNFDRPPTVTLDQGSGVGILFMSDVTLNGMQGPKGGPSQQQNSFQAIGSAVHSRITNSPSTSQTVGGYNNITPAITRR